MAYTPIGNKTKTGGYTPIGNKATVKPQTYQELFPATQMVSRATATLPPTQPKPKITELAREIVAPKRGFSDEETAKAQPTLKETGVGLAKAAGEIGLGISQITSMGLRQIPGLRNLAGDEDVLNKYSEALLPKTAGEAKAMRAADIAGFAGTLGASKIPGLIKTVTAVDNINDARKILKAEGITDDVIQTNKLAERAVSTKTAGDAKKFVDELISKGLVKGESLPPLPKAPARKPVTSVATKADEVPTPITPVRTAQVAKDEPNVLDPRNFKTAEEFVAAQGETVFRGGNKTFDKTLIGEDGVFVTPSKFMAGTFGDNVDELVISSKAKVLSYNDLPASIKSLNDWDEYSVAVSKYGREKGVDVIDSLPAKADFPRGMERTVLNPDVIQTKSQLTNIWNQAQKTAPTTPVAELPPLPKLAPEMRQAIERGQADATVTKALQERYRSVARRPEVQDNELATAAKSDKTPSDIAKVAGKLLTPISSRLRRINPELETSLRKLEYDAAQSTYQGLEEIRPLLKAKQKMTKEEQGLFDLAQLNGDTELVNAFATKYNIQDEVNRARDVLDDLFTRGNEVGMDIPYRKGYFPRVVKNPKAYLNYWRGRDDWGDINRLIEEEAKKKNINYFDLMKDEEKVTSIINNYIRGYGSKTVLAAPSFAKGRTIAVLDDELAEFYESADSALATYVVRMNDEIAARKYFGKKTDGDADISDSIGAHVLKLVAEGKIKPQQQEEVAEILRSRFHRGKMYGALDVYRNAEYLSTMGNPISAITQVGDFAWSLYENGFWKTAKALAGKKKITRESLGFDMAVMNEFTKDSLSGAAVDKVFKAVGLDKMARLGQETFVNANFSKFQQQARNNSDELKMQLDRMFDSEESALAMKEFAEGKITDRTRFVVFNRLLDFQPLTKSEMPEVYLNNPNGRLFYMLKSFTLKQYDLYRREAFDLIATGEKAKVAKGMKNLMSLAALFVMANATADEIKDLVTGRETPLSDRITDNLWRLVGASKFDVYQAREDGLGTAIVKKILFPVSVVDRLSKDIETTVTDKRYEKGPMAGEKYKFESTQTIPVGGKLYYWWFGRGAQKEEYKATRTGTSTRADGLPPLPPKPPKPPAPPKPPKPPKPGS